MIFPKRHVYSNAKIDNIFKQAFCTFNIYKEAYRTNNHGFGYVMSAFLIKIWFTIPNNDAPPALSTTVQFSQTGKQNKLLNICKLAYRGLNICKEAYACLWRFFVICFLAFLKTYRAVKHAVLKNMFCMLFTVLWNVMGSAVNYTWIRHIRVICNMFNQHVKHSSTAEAYHLLQRLHILCLHPKWQSKAY